MTSIQTPLAQVLTSDVTSNVNFDETEVSNKIRFSVTSHQALIITAFHEPLSIANIPIPVVKDNDILVRNRAIGLNPIDWKGKKYRFGVYDFPWVNGRESSGDVVLTGRNVTQFSENDKVIISSTSYRDIRTSTFQEYTAVDSRLVWKLPHFLSYEDGATLGVGLVTAGIILYKSFGFELTSNPVKKSSPGTILIWGGATVVGIYIIQLAKIIGLKVITVASSDNESYLRELGSDEVIDRFLPIEEIKNKIQGRIDYGVDCVSKETSQLVLEVLGENAGTSKLKPLFAGIVGLPKEYPENVEFRETVIKQFHEDVGYGNDFVKVTTEFLTARKLQPVRYKSYNGGLGSIHKGLLDLEAIGAKAEKYVVSV